MDAIFLEETELLVYIAPLPEGGWARRAGGVSKVGKKNSHDFHIEGKT